MRLQTPSDLARIVKNARVQRNLTQQEVADTVGITRQSLARLERGNAGISFDTVLLILDQLGLHLIASADDSTAPAAAATGSAALAASDALAKRIAPLIASDALPERLAVPGSVLIDPTRTVGAESATSGSGHTDAAPDSSGTE